MTRSIRLAAFVAAACLTISAAHAAEEPVLNLYSARHYQTDEALYNNFTKATGIKINRIEAGDAQLLERLKTEGANGPADVLQRFPRDRCVGTRLRVPELALRRELRLVRLPA